MRRTVRAVTVLGDNVSYLVRDEFSTNRAAGAINSTAAEPGPGTRAVTDGNSKLTISNGILDFATGGVGGGNPGLWYAQLSGREKGQLLVARQTFNTSGVSIGFDSGQSGSLVDAFRMNSTSLGIVINSANLTVGTVATDTAYQVALVRRAIGCMYFIKGGTFTEWTLVYVSAAGNGAPFPGISAIGATTVATVDYYRIPSLLWMPSPLVSDGFGSTFGTTDGLGHAETTGLGSGGGGKTWTQATGTWATSSGTVAASALSGGLASATTPVSTADCLVGVDMTRSAGVAGGVARYTDASNHIRFYHDGTNAVVQQVLAGSTSTLVTSAIAYSAGARLRLRLTGTSCRLFYNDASAGTGTINAALTAAKVGLYTTDTGNTLDNFVCYAGGSNGEYSGLNSF